MVSSDMRNPAKSTILRAKWNFSALRTIPAWPTRMRKSMVLQGSAGRSHSGWCHPHNAPFAQSQIVSHRSGGCIRHPRKGSRPRVSPSSERSDEGCEVTVRLTEGDDMISVSGITDCFPRAFRYSSRQVKWRFGWEYLPFAMFIQRR